MPSGLNETKKKVSPNDNQPEKVNEVAPVISKMETTESYITADSVKDLYGVTTDKKLYL
jgi:hypothetical protein